MSCLSNGQGEMGLCVMVVNDDLTPHNRKQMAPSAALQMEPADEVKVTLERTHRPRAPMKKNPTVCQLSTKEVDQRYTGPRDGHQQQVLRASVLGCQDNGKSLFTTVFPH